MKIQTKHQDDIDNLLRGATDIEAIQQAYHLPSETRYKLMNRISHIYEIQVEMMRILAETEAKRTGIHFTYKDHINLPDKENYLDDWSFIMNLAYDYSYIFHDCEDNYAVTNLLEEEGIIGYGMSDPEMCCSYFYFKSKQEAEGFLNRLNTFCNARLSERKTA